MRAEQVGTRAPKKHTPKKKATKKARAADDERVLSEAMKRVAVEKAATKAAAFVTLRDEPGNPKAARQPPPASSPPSPRPPSRTGCGSWLRRCFRHCLVSLGFCSCTTSTAVVHPRDWPPGEPPPSPPPSPARTDGSDSEAKQSKKAGKRPKVAAGGGGSKKRAADDGAAGPSGSTAKKAQRSGEVTLISSDYDDPTEEAAAPAEAAPAAAEGKASAKQKRAATKEEKVLRMLSNSCLDVTHSTPHPSLCAGREAQALPAHPDLVPALHGGREGKQLFAETAPTEGNRDRDRQAVEAA